MKLTVRSSIISDRECTFVNVLSWILGLGAIGNFVLGLYLVAFGVITLWGYCAFLITSYLLIKVGFACAQEVHRYRGELEEDDA